MVSFALVPIVGALANTGSNLQCTGRCQCPNAHFHGPVAICCVLCCAALLYSPLQRGRWLFFPPPRRVWCTQPLPTPAREMASRPKLTALPLIPLTSTRCELVCPSPDDITLR
eukprot:GGOE01029205.1.p3 GENE.GGOE01029205.1~~GGOE01029205.1.p3  ORF type:complete len:113 (-),score=0.34 GGOE01029205.1:1042-1380(-)